MSKALKVLVIEESVPKTSLLVRELEEGDFFPITERVVSAEAMAAALDGGSWDVVIADYNMESFNALDALEVIKERGLELPFIVVADPIGQGIAAAALQAGADDVVMRSNLVRLAPAVDRAIREATDRRERKLAEDALEDTRRYLVSLIESSTDAIISTNRDGLVVLFNRGAEELLGYRRDEVLGHRARMLYESEERAKEVREAIRSQAGKVSAHETNLRTKDGTSVSVLISASLLYDDEGEEAGTVRFIKDLRERKRSEERLRQAHEELQKAYGKLERAQALAVASEKMAALGRLSSGISHEILNPLNVITMNLHMMLADPTVPERFAEDLRDMESQAERIAKISKALLYFARQGRPEHSRLDLNDALERALSLMEHELRLAKVSVETDLAERLPRIYADGDQIHQVVLHLLANARDAMEEGGRLALSTKVVEKDGLPFAELLVEDTGRGIPPENLDKLFDPFFSTKAEGGGTGLGLSVCQGIVESHGGSIWAESEVGRGTRLFVRLPLEAAQEGAARPDLALSH